MQIIEGVVVTIQKEVKEHYNSNSRSYRKSTISFVSLDSTYAWYHGGMKVQAGDKLVLIGTQKEYRNRPGLAIAGYYNLSQHFLSIHESQNPITYLFAAVLSGFGGLSGYGAYLSTDRVVGFILLSVLLFGIGLMLLFFIYRDKRVLRKLKRYLEANYENLPLPPGNKVV